MIHFTMVKNKHDLNDDTLEQVLEKVCPMNSYAVKFCMKLSFACDLFYWLSPGFA